MGKPPSPWFKVLAFALSILGLATAAHAQSILPDATAGEAYSFQLVTNPPQAAGTTYTAQGLPQGLSVGATTGIISGTTGTVGLFKGTLQLTLNGSVNPFLFQITVDPQAGAPTITSAGTVTGTVGTPLDYTIAATNGPTSYNIAQLPPGLSASGGEISGTPTAAGLYFTSTSANNGDGQGAILVIEFDIDPAGPIPSDTSPLVVSTEVGASFSFTLGATNNPTSFSATKLPAGLTLNTSTGVISGAATTAGVYNVPIEEINGYGQSLPRNLVITVGDYSSITSATTASMPAGNAFSYSLAASNSPLSYSVTGLPAGLTYNSTSGAISGTPTTAGTYTLTAVATNALGAGPAATLTFSVTNPSTGTSGPTPPLILVQPLAQSVVLGSTAQFAVDAVGTGALAYQWTFNGTPISGQNAPTLTLAFVDSTDAGAYSVTVTSPLGSAVSNQVGLNVLSLFVPPGITSYPLKTTATAGSPVSFTVAAAGSPPLSYQWLLGGAPIAGATDATYTIPSVSVADAGSYSAVVSNPAGSTASPSAVLTVAASAFAPIFQYQPSPTAVNVGGTATLLVGIVGSPPTTYQWSKNGVVIPGATSASLMFSPAQLSDSGNYSVVITDPAGTVTSTAAALTVQAAGGPPMPVSIVVQPEPVSVAAGGTATFSVAVTGDATVTYQWRKNQQPIPGTTGPTFTVYDVHPSDAGTYDVEVANAFSATISTPNPLVVLPGLAPSHLINVSARGYSGTGSQTLIVGLVVGGSGPEAALVRAVGPSLSEFGVTGLLADPQLTLFSSTSGSEIGSNDNWGGSAALASAFGQVGAFSLPPTSLDSAVLTTLQPGPYTAEVNGANGGTGVVLLEAYDADSTPTPTAHFINVSARGFCGTGSQALTVGFVVAGGANETILIRGVGPTLASFGVSGAMAQPQLTVTNANQNVVGSNNGWGGSANLQSAFQTVNAFSLPTTSSDAAVLVTLPPGAYTAQVSGANGNTGIALVELYEMP